MGKFTFRKEERVKKSNDIQELFDKGSSFYLYPYKVLVLPEREAGPHRILISVSKRNYGKAVERNSVKRRIREAYRLNKHLLPPDRPFRIGFIYTAKEILPAREFSSKMVHALRRVATFPGAA